MSKPLDSLLKDIRACRVCRDGVETDNQLPHEPRPVFQISSTARICVAGQAPGTRVHASGIPFTDPSGDRLREWMGVSDEQFYDAAQVAIIPMGFCFPGLDAKGGDLPPRKECPKLWRERLFEHLPQIDLMLLIGGYAQSWHMGSARAKTLTETIRNWDADTLKTHHPAFIPLPHPSWRNNSWLKKNPWFEARILPVVKREVRARLS